MALVLQMEEKQLMVIFNYSYEMEKNSNSFKVHLLLYINLQ